MRILLNKILPLLGKDISEYFLDEIRKLDESELIINNFKKEKFSNNENYNDSDIVKELSDNLSLRSDLVLSIITDCLEKYFTKLKVDNKNFKYPVDFNPLLVAIKLRDLSVTKIDETRVYIFLYPEVRSYFRNIIKSDKLIIDLFKTDFYVSLVKIFLYSEDLDIDNPLVVFNEFRKLNPTLDSSEYSLKITHFINNAKEYFKSYDNNSISNIIETIVNSIVLDIQVLNTLKLCFEVSNEQNLNNSIDEYLNKFQKIKLPSFRDSVVDISSLDLTDLNLVKTIIDTNSSNLSVVPSSIKLYNDSTPYGGYVKGELICISSPPKCGKSAFLIQETSHMIKNCNKKVLHCCIGDMKYFDIITRLLSSFYGNPLQGTAKFVNGDNTISYFVKGHAYDEISKPEYHDIFKNNVRFSCLTVNQYDVFELVDMFKKIKNTFDFDVVMIDYDLNIRKTNESNMYDNGGIIYETLKRCANDLNCVVIVATQPKNSYWQEEILTAECLSESSRKQHMIDSLITINRNLKCKTLGTYNIAYMRRGDGGLPVRLYFDYPHSTIIPINSTEYNQRLKGSSSVGDAISEEEYNLINGL